MHIVIHESRLVPGHFQGHPSCNLHVRFSIVTPFRHNSENIYLKIYIYKHMQHWNLWHSQATNGQVSLRICADSHEPSLLTYTKYRYRLRLGIKTLTFIPAGYVRTTPQNKNTNVPSKKKKTKKKQLEQQQTMIPQQQHRCLRTYNSRGRWGDSFLYGRQFAILLW